MRSAGALPPSFRQAATTLFATLYLGMYTANRHYPAALIPSHLLVQGSLQPPAIIIQAGCTLMSSPIHISAFGTESTR